MSLTTCLMVLLVGLVVLFAWAWGLEVRYGCGLEDENRRLDEENRWLRGDGDRREWRHVTEFPESWVEE